MTEERDREATRRWVDDAEEALNRTGEALRTAWEETRDARMSALEAAREAVNRLGVAIDQGIESARKSWEPSATDETSDPRAETETGPAGTEEE